MSGLDTSLARDARIAVPLIAGAMFPCSNPELVAAVSEAGGIGIVQPLSMVYVHGRELREGLRFIRRLTAKPIGMNVLIEQSSRMYLDRMKRWVDVALEEGIRFFITSLGKPSCREYRLLRGARVAPSRSAARASRPRRRTRPIPAARRAAARATRSRA